MFLVMERNLRRNELRLTREQEFQIFELQDASVGVVFDIAKVCLDRFDDFDQ